MCPHCQKNEKITKRGFYERKSDGIRIQRFFCHSCRRDFSAQTSSYDYRLRKRRINQAVFRLLAKGLSQNGIAQVLQVDPKTIARRVTRFGNCARKHLFSENKKVDQIVFDEMESFEHTKLKPVTIPLAVEKGTRKILYVGVGKIAAKGHLAQISRQKYGARKCERKKVLDQLFTRLECIAGPDCLMESDESHHYPKFVKKYFSEAIHKRYKGRKPISIGQGELKTGGFDPLFSLNQTAAMIRDNIKRLARRTWCTTKKIPRLLDLLYIYSFYHNQIIIGIKRPSLFNCPSSI